MLSNIATYLPFKFCFESGQMNKRKGGSVGIRLSTICCSVSGSALCCRCMQLFMQRSAVEGKRAGEMSVRLHRHMDV